MRSLRLLFGGNMIQLTMEDLGVIAKLVKTQIKVGGKNQVNLLGSIQKELTSILPQINVVLMEKQIIHIDNQRSINKLINGV